MRHLQFLMLVTASLLIVPWFGCRADEPSAPWRALPLVENGRVAPGWVQVGWGGFAVEGQTLRTDCDERGLGLLLYRREKFGNCRIRVVYKVKDSRSNSGVFVRIDDGILLKLDEKPVPARRDQSGQLTEESLQSMMQSSAKELGPWYAVNYGYEVQICDEGDPLHHTGAIYSLAKAADPGKAPADGWRTMIITLRGDLVLVEVDGKQITRFDPNGSDVPKERQWYEPKREPQRPQIGYIGLQNHDPGDVVSFKEVSVQPLE